MRDQHHDHAAKTDQHRRPAIDPHAFFENDGCECDRDFVHLAADHGRTRSRHSQRTRAGLSLDGGAGRFWRRDRDADPAFRRQTLRGRWRHGGGDRRLDLRVGLGVLYCRHGDPDTEIDAKRDNVIDRVLFFAGHRACRCSDAAVCLAYADRFRTRHADLAGGLRRHRAYFSDRKLSPRHRLSGGAVRLLLDAVGAAARLLGVRRIAELARLYRRDHRRRRWAVRDLARTPTRLQARARGGRTAAAGNLALERLEGDDGVGVLDAGQALHLLIDEVADLVCRLLLEKKKQIIVASGRVDFGGYLGFGHLVGHLIVLAELAFDLDEERGHRDPPFTCA